MMVWFLAAMSCGGTDVLDALAPPKAEVRVEVDSAKVESGEPVVIEVAAWSSEGWTVQAGVPVADGLTVEMLEEGAPAVVDDRTVQVTRYALTGPDGSYVVGTTEGQAAGPSDQTRSFEVPPIFVDIGVDGPVGGAMDGFAESPPPKPTPYSLIAAAIAAGLVLIAVIWWCVRRLRMRAAEPPPATPPHIVAQGAWVDARSTITDDHALALRLSMVLREYLESITPIAATAATTMEIADGLRHHGFGGRPLGDAERVPVERILDSTDRLKFAREGGGDAFFEALDKDFETVINASRPRASAGDSDA